MNMLFSGLGLVRMASAAFSLYRPPRQQIPQIKMLAKRIFYLRTTYHSTFLLRYY